MHFAYQVETGNKLHHEASYRLQKLVVAPNFPEYKSLKLCDEIILLS